MLIRLSRIAVGTEKARGPGSFLGRPYVALTFKITNNSRRVLDLNQVVVTAQYGTPARLASPVYGDASAKDFAGILKPGSSVAATYLFAISHQGAGNFATIVDFDGRHVLARFNGALH